MYVEALERSDDVDSSEDDRNDADECDLDAEDADEPKDKDGTREVAARVARVGGSCRLKPEGNTRCDTMPCSSSLCSLCWKSAMTSISGEPLCLRAGRCGTASSSSSRTRFLPSHVRPCFWNSCTRCVLRFRRAALTGFHLGSSKRLLVWWRAGGGRKTRASIRCR
jgi:hypothetical protein